MCLIDEVCSTDFYIRVDVLNWSTTKIQIAPDNDVWTNERYLFATDVEIFTDLKSTG